MSFFTALKEKLHRPSLDEAVDAAFSGEDRKASNEARGFAAEKVPFSQQVLEGKQRFENERHPNPMATVNRMAERNLGTRDISAQFARQQQQAPPASLAESFRRERSELPPELQMMEPNELGNTPPLLGRAPPSMPPPLQTTDRAREFIGTRQSGVQTEMSPSGNEPAPRPVMRNEKRLPEGSDETLHEILEQQRNIISILREIQKHMRI